MAEREVLEQERKELREWAAADGPADPFTASIGNAEMR